MSRLDDLKRNPLFQNVPEEALRDAARVVTQRHFAAGEIVVAQDAQGEALHLLTSGVVRVSRVSTVGRQRVMGEVYAPGVIGETAVLSGGERSATVQALGEVTTLMLYRTHFQQLLQRHPQVLWNLSVMLVERVTFLNDELIAFGLNTQAALSHVFLHLYRQRLAAGVPEAATLPLSTNDIMLRISSSRETVSRVMRTLAGLGLVQATSNTVVLLDPEGLGDLSLEEADPAD